MSVSKEKKSAATEKAKQSPIRMYVVPTITLAIISIVVSGTLAFTHGVTAPIIQKNLEAVEKQAAEEVLGDAEGQALKTEIKSYGGKLTMMVGISTDGAVTGVKILTHQDTPGLGTQPMDPEYLKQYVGITELTADQIKDDDTVEAVTGATISSNAIYNGVKQALSDYNEKGGGQE